MAEKYEKKIQVKKPIDANLSWQRSDSECQSFLMATIFLGLVAVCFCFCNQDRTNPEDSRKLEEVRKRDCESGDWEITFLFGYS